MHCPKLGACYLSLDRKPAGPGFMSISIGDRLPEAKFQIFSGGDPYEETTDQVFSGKRVAVFSMPGAFTRGCSARIQLPVNVWPVMRVTDPCGSPIR